MPIGRENELFRGRGGGGVFERQAVNYSRSEPLRRKLPAVKVGARCVRIPRRALEQLVNEDTQNFGAVIKNMVLKAFLSRLEHVRRNGAGWIARCPAHVDHNPSFAIREVEGKILLHCHAGCTVEAIFVAMGLKMSDLFVDSDDCSAPEGVAEYSYCGELRQTALSSRAIRAEGISGSGGPMATADGPGTSTASGAFSIGCRKCSRLSRARLRRRERLRDGPRKLGFTATCNAGGAGKWRDEYRRHSAVSALSSSRMQMSQAGSTRDRWHIAPRQGGITEGNRTARRKGLERVGGKGRNAKRF